MILSYRLLQRFFPTDELPPASELFATLTGAGLEGEAMTGVRDLVGGMVAAKIGELAPIEGTALRHGDVDLGAGRSAHIVTAEPTVAAGETIAYAPPGSVVGGVEIGVRKLGGIESEGMLLSRAEAGVGGEGGRAWRVTADPGDSLAELLDDDVLLDFGITPNRGDQFSHLGVAREVAVLHRLREQLPDVDPVLDDFAGKTVELDDPDCPYYMGVWLSLAGEPGPVPPEVEAVLGRCGMRSVHPLVDLTNYVMLELGQPMHVFDADKLEGQVRVRAAKAGETIVTLDDEERELLGGELIIADEAGPVAIAGVMGGARAEAGPETRRVLLESAYFAPDRVSRSRRPHHLGSEASTRFERGVDPVGAERAAARFMFLLREVAEATVEGVHRAGAVPAPTTVPWDPARAERLLGALPDEATTEAILDGLGFTPNDDEPDRRDVPPWRFDVEGTADLAEEVARIWGYDQLERTLPASLLAEPVPVTPYGFRARMLDVLVEAGYHQGIHYSFSSDTGGDAVLLANPMGAQTAALRRELAPGLLLAAATNHRRQEPDLKLAEIGKVFRADGKRVVEQWRLGLIASGDADPAAWRDRRPIDLYDVKGDLERLFDAMGMAGDIRWEAPAADDVSEPWHPVRYGRLTIDGEPAGFVAEVEPAQYDALELHAPTVVAEIAVEPLWRAWSECPPTSFVPIPRFPGSERDLALLLDRDAVVEAVIATIREAAGEHLQAVRVFDVYAGKGIPEGRQSVAFRLRFGDPEGTLAQETVDGAVDAVVAAVKETHGAELR